MNTFLTILLALFVFGLLILIHELGHYAFARLFHVRIEEFSVGMGPRLLSRTSKKTGIRYSLSAFPIGGYVAMAGEDGESDDPDSFGKKPAWQRFIITAAGATVNIIAGFLAVVVLTCMVNVGGTTVAKFVPKEETGYVISSEEQGLCVGDRILSVNGKSVRISEEVVYEIMRAGAEPVDLVVLRDGERVALPDVSFPTEESEGQLLGSVDFYVYRAQKTFGTVLVTAARKGVLIFRMCWESIFDLIRGRYTFAAVSGPVGISSAIGDAARLGFASFLNIVALISINLGVMNLLPIPALDGGRLAVTLVEMVTRKRLPPKVEGIINGVGFALLMLLTVVIFAKDIWQLIVR